MTKFPSRAQKWYTTGQPRAAFDVRGWQKLPEYALIRIPAGAQNCRFSPVFPVQKVRRFSPAQKRSKVARFPVCKVATFLCAHTRIRTFFLCAARKSFLCAFCVTKFLFRQHTPRQKKFFSVDAQRTLSLSCLSVACCTLFLRVHTFCKCAHTQRAQH